ncbi:hypothetical protein WR25_13765 [Diploscapter pachys]|uniref:Uncharacterized protein n=1 Tax=Diploscapter pachys TaxID=2018661 RepID=A0A2A2K3I7_9BILA|nr:hypothetical protein WR25_13765 [Diploscapter pachys]
MAVVIGDLAGQHLDAMLRPLQPLGGADDADVIPHEAADFGPVLLDDHLFVRIGDAAFVPGPDHGDGGQAVPMRGDMVGARLAEHETFEQAVGREARPGRSVRPSRSMTMPPQV